MSDEIVFSTPWFQIVGKPFPHHDSLHYSLRTNDYVCVVALTQAGQMLLVRQYRPAVGRMTLELPSGHVEKDDSPEVAARQELLEETGYVAESLDLIGAFSPDTGRLANRMWCFFAADARPTSEAGYHPEPGIEPVLFAGTLTELLAQEGFDCALHAAALFLAVLRGRLALGDT